MGYLEVWRLNRAGSYLRQYRIPRVYSLVYTVTGRHIMARLLISGLAVIIAASSSLVNSAGVPLIIDTDASFDVDDVVAVCMAHALMDRGEVDIKAIVHDAGIPEGIGAMSVLNHYYGHDDILLGAYKVTKYSIIVIPSSYLVGRLW